MPVPAPNESRNDFMSRCIDELISVENRPQSQAIAICSSKWEEKKDVVSNSSSNSND